MADPHIEHLVPLADESLQAIVQITSGVDFTLFAAPGAGLRNYLRFIVVTTDDIANQFLVKNGPGGAVLARLLAKANDNAEYEFNPALRFSENTAVTVAISGAISTSYHVTGVGYKRAN